MDVRQSWTSCSGPGVFFSRGFACGGRGGGGHHRRGGPFGFGGQPPGGSPFGPGFPWTLFRRGSRARRGDVRAAKRCQPFPSLNPPSPCPTNVIQCLAC